MLQLADGHKTRVAKKSGATDASRMCSEWDVVKLGWMIDPLSCWTGTTALLVPTSSCTGSFAKARQVERVKAMIPDGSESMSSSIRADGMAKARVSFKTK